MRIVLKGTVQGVGFRPTVYRVAESLSLNGYVKNLGSEVEVVIDGDVDEFLERLNDELPPLAEIDQVEVYEKEVKRDGFEIIKSGEGERSSPIPVDTAICPDCIEEMNMEGDRRHDYPFINCTDCGARYSAIRSLPFDRDKTTMAEFPMCESCGEEYGSPRDRRFHAQTISCPDCGPEYTLYDAERNEIGGIDEFAELIQEGEIGVAKSWGGMHIVCRLDRIPELRERYGREQKPLALMMPDVDTVERYAEVEREGMLKGPRRPIMVFKKKDFSDTLMEYAAPGLPTVGIMLPYTALHHILFKKIDLDGLVMTSANPPGEPMVIRNRDAFDLDFDYFLLHNRRIANRIDDSLIRVQGGRVNPIRRSRGFVPGSFDVSYEERVLGAGADQSGCFSLSKDKKLYPSPYLGELGSHGGKRFYEDTFDHLTSLLGIGDLEAVGVDLHPQYQSRNLGRRYADEFDAEVIEIQHHWAHGVSLMEEHGTDDMVCIAVDGTGYGEDGNSWGGEILYCNRDGYERRYHLQPFPLLGGDKAVEDPRRSVYAIDKQMGVEPIYFDGKKAGVFDKMMEDSVKTTSMGRLFDAVSSVLDVCQNRTYEGEPAMKLEKLLMQGERNIEYEVHSEGGTIHTLEGFIQMQQDGGKKAADRAVSYISALAEEMTECAVEAAEEHRTDNIGISGGVSYDAPLLDWVRDKVEEKGYDLLVHEKIPSGDMGISIGQASIAAEHTG